MLLFHKWHCFEKLIVSVEEQAILNKYENDPGRKLEVLNKLMAEQREELKKFDMNLVVQLDQKVCEYMYFNISEPHTNIDVACIII